MSSAPRMEGSIAYSAPIPPPGTTGHQPSSFGIDNILTGMHIGAGPTQLSQYRTGCDHLSSVPSMILRKIDNATADHKRESVSSTDGDDEDGFRKKKKPRTAFSREQVTELEKKFNEKKYLSSAERGELAEKLKLSDMQVKTWFQNRRMKFKRQTEEAEMELKSPKYPYGPFVPYTSIYGYMPYKATEYGNGTNGTVVAAGTGNGYGSSLYSCSQQYSSTLNSPTDSFSNGGYNGPPSATLNGGILSPAGVRYPTSDHPRGSVYNRGGVSPLASPTTPVSESSYSTNYFNGDFVATPHYNE